MITSQTATYVSKKIQREQIFKEIALASSNGLESCLIDKTNDELINELKGLDYIILLVDGYYFHYYRCVWGEEALKIKNRSFLEKIFSTYKII